MQDVQEPNHVTVVGYEQQDLNYRGRCSCGVERRECTWEKIQQWRDEHIAPNLEGRG